MDYSGHVPPSGNFRALLITALLTGVEGLRLVGGISDLQRGLGPFCYLIQNRRCLRVYERSTNGMRPETKESNETSISEERYQGRYLHEYHQRNDSTAPCREWNFSSQGSDSSVDLSLESRGGKCWLHGLGECARKRFHLAHGHYRVPIRRNLSGEEEHLHHLADMGHHSQHCADRLGKQEPEGVVPSHVPALMEEDGFDLLLG